MEADNVCKSPDGLLSSLRRCPGLLGMFVGTFPGKLRPGQRRPIEPGRRLVFYPGSSAMADRSLVARGTRALAGQCKRHAARAILTLQSIIGIDEQEMCTMG